MTTPPEALEASQTLDPTPEQALVLRAQGYALGVADQEQRECLLSVIALALLAANRRAANRHWADRRRAAVRTMPDAERAQLNALRRMQRNERAAATRPVVVVPPPSSRPTTGLLVVGPPQRMTQKAKRNGVPPSGGVGGGVRGGARTADGVAVAGDAVSSEEPGEATAQPKGAEVVPADHPVTEKPSSRPEGARPSQAAAPLPKRRRGKLDQIAEDVLSDPLDMAGARGKKATAPKVTTTWLTPYHDAWKAAGGGVFNGGEAARWLAKLEKEHGAAAVLERWKVLLAKTPLRFVSAFMLAKAWVDFAPGGQRVVPVAERASMFWSVAVANRWMSARDRDDVQQALERTLAKGVVTFDAAEVLEFLFRINRRELNEAGAWAPKKLAEYGDVPVITYTEDSDGE